MWDRKWRKTKRWIANNGTALQFIGWAIGAVVATTVAISPFLKKYFTPGTAIVTRYTVDASDIFAPAQTKTLTAVCRDNDLATGWLIAPNYNPKDADPIPSNVQPVISNERQIGFTVTVLNGAGTNMGHPNVTLALEVSCKS